MAKKCTNCNSEKPYAKFYGDELQCTVCKEKKRVEREHRKVVTALQEKIDELEKNNAELLEDKRFLRSVVKEQRREIEASDVVRAECDTKMEQIQEEIYALKSSHYKLDVRTKELNGLMQSSNVGLLGYMSKVDEMKEEIADLNSITTKQMELHREVNNLLNRCIVHRVDGDHLFIPEE